MESDGIIILTKRILIFMAVFIFQVVFADSIRIFGVAPNVMLCYVMAVSFKNYPVVGLITSIIAGVMMDSVSGRVFGAYTFYFVSFELLIKYLYYKLFSENMLFEILFGFALCFIYSLFYVCCTWLFRGNFLNMLFKISIIEFLYNFVIFTVFLYISKKVKKKRRKSAFKV